jgi:hypothetical protein
VASGLGSVFGGRHAELNRWHADDHTQDGADAYGAATGMADGSEEGHSIDAETPTPNRPMSSRAAAGLP